MSSHTTIGQHTAWRASADLLACPDCAGPLRAAEERDELACPACSTLFEVRDGIPVLLPKRWSEQARESVLWWEGAESFFDRRFQRALTGGIELPPQFLAWAPAGGRALDCGSGSGILAAVYARLGFTAVGLDVSFRGAALGAELARRWGLGNCLFVVGDAAQLPFRAGAFDLVAANGLLEHLYDIERFAAQAARVLRPGGRLIAHDVNRFLNPVLTRLRPSLDPGRLRLFIPPLAALLIPSRRARLARTLSLDLSAGSQQGMGSALGQAKANRPVSYLIRDAFAQHLRVRWYRTFLLHLHGKRFLTDGTGRVVEAPVRRRTRWLSPGYHAMNHLPIIRHTGEAIHLVAEAPR
jgi:SAM-dependent methyltransferase